MNFVPAGLLAVLTTAQLEALDDLEHQCDLISVRPTPFEVRWTLERAGLGPDLCGRIADAEQRA